MLDLALATNSVPARATVDDVRRRLDLEDSLSAADSEIDRLTADLEETTRRLEAASFALQLNSDRIVS